MVNTGDMFPGKDYVFRVIGAKEPARETITDYTLSVLPAAAPSVHIA